MSPSRATRNVLTGVAISPGVAIGPVVFLDVERQVAPRRHLRANQIEAEVRRFRQGLRAAEDEFRAEAEKFQQEYQGTENRIFEAHLQFYQDQMFQEAIEKRIRDDSVNAEAAIHDEVERLSAMLRSMDSLFRERQADIRDVGERINRVLLRREQATVEGGDRPFVLYARELLPSHTLGIDRSRLLAMVTEVGGDASHVAILARAFGIPAVSGITQLTTRASPGAELAVDGSHGRVVVRPTTAQRTDFRKARKSWVEQRSMLLKRAGEKARAESEEGVQVLLNVENFEGLPQNLLKSVAGVGLYRTEFLFMERDTLPSEDEQYEFYGSVLDKLDGIDVTFRTIDVGGDKPLRSLQLPEEQNPVLGWRGIRLTFEWPDLLIPQLRALLRAQQHGNLKILLPMVSTVEEMRRARTLIEGLRDDLVREGCDVPLPPIGAMIELPVAALSAGDLAEEADFLSIGTNDLVQYVFAVDRNNLRVSSLYQPLHPAMLRLLGSVIEAADAQGKEVTVCGEMAGQVLPALALLGLGLRRFSMSPAHVPEARLVFELFRPEEAAALVRQLTGLRTEQEVAGRLRKAVEQRAAEAKQTLPWSGD